MHIIAELKRESFVTRAYVQDANPGKEKVVAFEMDKVKRMVEKYSDLEKAQKAQRRINRQKRLAQFSIDQKIWPKHLKT